MCVVLVVVTVARVFPRVAVCHVCHCSASVAVAITMPSLWVPQLVATLSLDIPRFCIRPYIPGPIIEANVDMMDAVISGSPCVMCHDIVTRSPWRRVTSVATIAPCLRRCLPARPLTPPLETDTEGGAWFPSGIAACGPISWANRDIVVAQSK